MAPRRFRATVVSGPGGRVLVPVPFDPNQVWGTKSRHHITGTVNGRAVRGPLEPLGEGFGVLLGAVWRATAGSGPATPPCRPTRPPAPLRTQVHFRHLPHHSTSP
jgi:hypothetical protein